MRVPDSHSVHGTEIRPPYPAGLETAIFAMGSFWGAEQLFWELEGVYTTAVGYAGGDLANPAYEEVCGGDTGHSEVVLVVFDPAVISYEDLLKVFWEGHDPTRDTRQSNDVRPQYRSVVFVSSDEQRRIANASRDRYEEQLSLSGRNRTSTEIAPAPSFYFAESDHQQYLAKNPSAYWHCVYVSLNTMTNSCRGRSVRRSGRDHSVVKW
jgi:peptide-methionine (S)-S-oxide reductase